jgi:hypothetical protein
MVIRDCIIKIGLIIGVVFLSFLGKGQYDDITVIQDFGSMPGGTELYGAYYHETYNPTYTYLYKGVKFNPTTHDYFVQPYTQPQYWEQYFKGYASATSLPAFMGFIYDSLWPDRQRAYIVAVEKVSAFGAPQVYPIEYDTIFIPNFGRDTIRSTILHTLSSPTLDSIGFSIQIVPSDNPFIVNNDLLGVYCEDIVVGFPKNRVTVNNYHLSQNNKIGSVIEYQKMVVEISNDQSSWYHYNNYYTYQDNLKDSLKYGFYPPSSSVYQQDSYFSYHGDTVGVGNDAGYVTFNIDSIPIQLNKLPDSINTANPIYIRVTEYVMSIPEELTKQYSYVYPVLNVIPPTPIVSYTLQPVTCQGNTDASLSIDSLLYGSTYYKSGDSLVFTFADTNHIVVSNDTVTNLPLVYDSLSPGTYELIIENEEGCVSDIITVVIPTVLPFTFDTTSVAHLICATSTTGSVRVAIQNGTAPYNYKLYNNTTNSIVQQHSTASLTHAFSSLAIGNYRVEVDDANSCSSSPANILVDIVSPDSIKPNISNLQNINCFGDSTGSIDMTGTTGGVLPYSYTFDVRATYQSIPLKQNLKAGFYIVLIEDANGCEWGTTVTLTEPLSALQLTIDSTKNAICNQLDNGVNLGDVYASANGGAGTYQFYSSNNLTKIAGTPNNVSLSNFLANTYTIYVEDGNQCIDSTSVVITEPAPITVNYIDTTLPTCINTPTGKFVLQINGGSPSYTVNTQITSSFYSDSLLYGDSTYTLFINDSVGCSKTDFVYLPESPIMQALFTVTHNSCYGDSTGSITPSISGGNGDTLNFSFAWRDSNNVVVSVNKNLINEPAGKYSLTVTDENGCLTTFNNLIVNQPQPIEIYQVSSVPTTCNNATNGIVTIDSVSGGISPYTYTVSGNSQLGNNIFTGLKDSAYSVLVADVNGCIADTQITVLPTTVLFSDSINNVNCYGDSNGKIILNGLTGSAPYLYHIYKNNSWISSGINEISNLPADTFNVFITDNNACSSDTQQVVINQQPQLIATATIIQNPFCELPNGITNGTTLGGSGPYTSQWLDTNTNAVNPNILLEGTYYYESTDSLGCVSSDTVTLINAPSPSISLHLLDSTYCNLPLGSVRVNVDSNATNPISLLWNDTGNQITDTAFNLHQGTYTVTLTDNRGCIVKDSITLTDGTAIQPQVITSINANCGQADGSVKVKAVGGVGTYTYSWNDPLTQTSDSANFLKAGSYIVTITDSVGCQVPFAVNIIDNSSPIINSFSVIDTSFCNLFNGAVTSQVSGGVAPYSYVWKDNLSVPIGQTTDTAVNLMQGAYTLQVTDSTGCITSSIITLMDNVSQSPLFSVLTIDSAACGKALGEIQVETTGGLAPYQYLWQHNNDTLSITDSLLAGTYKVWSTDNKGCKDSLNISVVDKTTPVISFVAKTNSDCNLPTGTATIQVNKGTPPYSFFWNDPLLQDSTTATQLEQGIYQVYMMDADSCLSNMLTINITDNPGMVISLIDLVPTKCSYSKDGQAEIQVSGLNSPFNYQWENGQNTARIDTLLQGDVKIYVIDTMGCTDSITVNIPAPPQLGLATVIKDLPTCFGGCDGEITVIGQGGSGTISYLWNTSIASSTISAICSGNYTVTLTDTNGCIGDSMIVLANPPKVTSIGQPDTAIICTGQEYIIDLSAGFFNSTWSRASDGWTFFGDTVMLNQADTYYVNTFNNNGCFVLDTFYLDTRNDILQANFIMPTETVIGDTIICIDVTWPVATDHIWEVPDTLVTQIDSLNDRISLVFSESGVYPITIKSSLGDCNDSLTKFIEVYVTRDSLTQGYRPLDNIDHILEVVIYPNPNNGSFTVNVVLDSIADVTISLFDLVNYINYEQQIQTGGTNYNFSFNHPNLQPGVYVLRLVSLTEVKLFKFVVR